MNDKFKLQEVIDTLNSAYENHRQIGAKEDEACRCAIQTAAHIYDVYLQSDKRGFDVFCETNKVTDDEREKLVEYLGIMRFQRTVNLLSK